MFSREIRCIYPRNPLQEVICQLRFPEILSIETDIPAKFQEAIRSDFPRYSQLKEQAPGGKQTNNHQFVSQDGLYRVNLTSKFISLSCCRYSRWEDFAGILDKPLVAFIQLYQPANFDRIGLRYVNIISRIGLGLEGTSFRELIEPCWLGILAEEDISEDSAARCTVDTDISLQGGCRSRIHAGPGKLSKNNSPDPETKFIFDIDLYMQGNIPVNVSAGALETLHSQSYSIFRGGITDTLHNALL